jgi:hypothetical protein
VNNGGHGAATFSTQQILTMMYNAMIATVSASEATSPNEDGTSPVR